MSEFADGGVLSILAQSCFLCSILGQLFYLEDAGVLTGGFSLKLK